MLSLPARIAATCTAALAALVVGCAAAPPGGTPAAQLATQVVMLPAAAAILLGEQHDADAHQHIQRELVAALASQGRLGALLLEMADQGTSTAGLAAQASEAQVREALRWNEAGWPWARYGPVVMQAVRAGIPVLGANLPRDRMRAAMADAALDARLDNTALQMQREAIREGHCQMLPESQIAPMTRIQIARDLSMAQTLAQAAAQAQPRTVVLIAGGMHVLPRLGVPAHLPPALSRQVVLAQAGDAGPASAPGAPQPDLLLRTPALEPRDYCAQMRGLPQRRS